MATEIQREQEIQKRVAAAAQTELASAIEDAMLAAADLFTTRQDAIVPSDHAARVETALQSLYASITAEMGQEMATRLKGAFPHLETKEDADTIYKRIWNKFMELYGAAHIVRIVETTRRQVRQLIDDGLAAGDSVAEIAKAIRDAAPTFSSLRSHIISRTETHSAAMYASTEVAKTSQFELVKEWVSVEDGRTRDFGEGDGVVDEFNHRQMDGVRVALDQPYRVPSKFGYDDALMFPGDPNGAAANVINCRCSQTYVRADAPVTIE